jgi:DNA-binding transcriptional LysR family regulator
LAKVVGRKIGDSMWAVYASRAYIERHGQPAGIEDLASHALVGLDDTMARHRIAQWLRNVAPDAPLAARSSSVLGLIYSVKAGIGIGPLSLSPCGPSLRDDSKHRSTPVMTAQGRGPAPGIERDHPHSALAAQSPKADSLQQQQIAAKGLSQSTCSGSFAS